MHRSALMLLMSLAGYGEYLYVHDVQEPRGQDDFLYIIEASRLLQFEGGYQAHPSDAGNWYAGRMYATNYGITAHAVAEYLKLFSNQTLADTLAFIRNMRPCDALDIYRIIYYEPVSSLPLPARLIAFHYMTASPTRAAAALYRIAKKYGYSGSASTYSVSAYLSECDDAYEHIRRAYAEYAKRSPYRGYRDRAEFVISTADRFADR